MQAVRRWTTARDNDAVAFFVVIGAAAVAGLTVAARVEQAGPLARPEFRLFTTLPLPIYPLAGVGALAVALTRNHWWTGLALFFAWLPFEDLVRKFAGNDIRVYFVKDALLAVAVLGVAPLLKDS